MNARLLAALMVTFAIALDAGELSPGDTLDEGVAIGFGGAGRH